MIRPKLRLTPASRAIINTLLIIVACNQAQAQSDTQLQNEARAIVQAFASQLKPALQQALSDGGPVHAIHVCSQEAPRIAEALSQEFSWQVKRVSLKARNASSAIPDDWEREQLKRFDERQMQGEKPSELQAAARVGGDYRYMQAQGVEALCLVCHGEKLDDSVKQALGSIYPDDLATGYQLGEVRGAISLIKSGDEKR